jgi:hypothetical protein
LGDALGQQMKLVAVGRYRRSAERQWALGDGGTAERDDGGSGKVSVTWRSSGLSRGTREASQTDEKQEQADSDSPAWNSTIGTYPLLLGHSMAMAWICVPLTLTSMP